MEDPQQVTLMELCNEGIGVYSPHTSVDGAVGGMNDWLAAVATGGLDAAVEPIIPVSVEGHESGGYGRVCTLLERTVINHVCKRVKNGLGLKYRILNIRTTANSSPSRSIANWKGLRGYTKDRNMCRIWIRRFQSSIGKSGRNSHGRTVPPRSPQLRRIRNKCHSLRSHQHRTRLSPYSPTETRRPYRPRIRRITSRSNSLKSR